MGVPPHDGLSCVARVGARPLCKIRALCWPYRLTDRIPVSDTGGAGSSPAGAMPQAR